MGILISVNDLCKTYIVNAYSNNVLKNISLTVDEGEFVSIMGPSGSGKSTLLYTMSGMDRMTSGTVIFSGKNLSEMNKKELAHLRLNEMGFIFQQMYMMKKLSILDNILIAGFQAGNDRGKVIDRAEMLMRRLGIIETADHEISEVSGGQLQRACLCRALINAPKIIFADEPTGALNSKAADDVMNELTAANNDGTAILMVTHNVRVAAKSERVLYLVDGIIKGELNLGRFEDDSTADKREKHLNAWLMELGW